MLVCAFWLVGALQQPVSGNSQVRAQQWKSAFGQVILHPTGANGYEEYVKAADLVANPAVAQFGAYESFLQQVEAGQKPDDVPNLPAGITPEMTLLEVQREHVRRCAASIDVIDRGNGKQVFDPRGQMDVNTLFPEFAEMRALARFATVDMCVCLSDGQPSRATSIATTMLTMRGKLPPTTLISELVGIAIDGILLGAISDNTDHFSERDWEKFIPVAEARLSYCGLKDVMTAEMRFELQTSETLRKGNVFTADGLGSGDDSESQDFAKAYNALSPGQRGRLTDAVQAQIRGKFSEILERYSGPEKTWVPAETPNEAVKFNGSLDSMTAAFVDILSPTFAAAAAAEVRDRTQIRLLKLHALIQIFRWHHGHLPVKLEQAAPKDSIDPLTDEAYIYEPSGTGYKLASKGIPQTGEIQLRYSRPKGGTQGPADPQALIR